MKRISTFLLMAYITLFGSAKANTNLLTQGRIDTDVVAGKPIVVHVVVALCDNANQGIVPVPATLGDGQDPKNNLYWGALYGVKTHLSRTSHWSLQDVENSTDSRILDRAILVSDTKRKGKVVPVYLVAEAWDGAYIKESIESYLDMLAGNAPVTMVINQRDDSSIKLEAGSSAHLLAYVGHNGLMEFSVETPALIQDSVNEPRSAVVLACASKGYFLDHFQSLNVHSLLLTRGLMAPEAYTLDATIHAWAAGGETLSVVEEAAKAYHKYQQCGMRGARGLFWGAP